MNPENPRTPREEIEVKLTALLLGELPPAEAAALLEIISRDAELARLHDRLKQTRALVRETAAVPGQEAASQPAPLKLSEERRQKLLVQFKTVTPKEFVRPSRHEFSWLVPVAATVAVLLLLAAFVLPNFMRARTTSQANAVINNLRQIDGAKQQWALENRRSADDVPSYEAIKPYLGRDANGGRLPSVAGESYEIGKVGEPPTVKLETAQARRAFKVPPSLESPTIAATHGADDSSLFLSMKGGPAAAPQEQARMSTWNATAPQSVAASPPAPAAAAPSEPSRVAIFLPTEKSADTLSGKAVTLGGEPTLAFNSATPAGTTVANDDSGRLKSDPGSAGMGGVTFNWANDRSKQGNAGLADGGVQGFSTSAMKASIDNSPKDREVFKLTPRAPGVVTLGEPDPNQGTLGLSYNGLDARNITNSGEFAMAGFTIEPGLAGATAVRADSFAVDMAKEKLITRSFRVDPETFRQGLENVGALDTSRAPMPGTTGSGGMGGGGGGGGYFVTATNYTASLQEGVRKFYSGVGVDLDPKSGKSVFYNDRTGELIIRGTPGEMEIVEAADQTLSQVPPQVTLKTKFVDASSSNLSFDWYLGNVKMEKETVSQPGRTFPTFGANQSQDPSTGLPVAGASEVAAVNPDKVPIVGDTPALGQLFRTPAKDESKSSVGRATTQSPKAAASRPAGGAVVNFANTAPAPPSAGAPARPGIVMPAHALDTPATPTPFQERLGNIVQRASVSSSSAPTPADMIQAKIDALPPAQRSQTAATASVAQQKEVRTLRNNVAESDPGGTQPTPLITADTLREYQKTLTAFNAFEAQQKVQLDSLKKLDGQQLREAIQTALPQPDAELAALKNELNASEQRLRSLEVTLTPDHPTYKNGQKSVEDLNRKIDLKVSGILAGLEYRLEQTRASIVSINQEFERAKSNDVAAAIAQSDVAPPKPAVPPPVPQPEIQTADNAFSTFSLNVSDVSFKLAAASLEKGLLPDPASIRSEEFINAFDYRDPEPAPGAPIAFASERARDPFAHNRDLLRFSLKTAAAGRQAGRPLNLVLLLDNSGSMERADRVHIIHEALRVLASQLQPQDTFSVVTFARTPRLWVDGLHGNQAGDVVEGLSGLTPEGGTNLEEAMNLAYATALRHYLANGINRVVLLTDGAANLGNVEPEALKQKVEAHRKQGIALDCFGIGWEGFNDDLLEVLSRNGDGRYGFINSPEEAATDFVSRLAGALKVAASDVKVQVEFNPKRVTSYRQIGYAKHQLTKEQFRDNTVDAAEIAAQEAGNALYTVEVNPAGEGPLCTVRVRYKIPGTGDYREQEWAVPFSGNAVSLEQSSPAMRLAVTASAFSEWLATSPFAVEVTTDRLLGTLSGVPEIYGADARPKKLEWMIRQAKAISGK